MVASDDESAGQGGDYGFSGRGGAEEGNYSGTYGRGAAGARDNPSASGLAGAGTDRGGNATPAPDPADVAAGGDRAADEGPPDASAAEGRGGRAGG